MSAPSAGYYRYQLIYFELTGGSQIDFFARGPGQPAHMLVGDPARQKLKATGTLLKGIGADAMVPGGGGADIGPSVREARIPSLALLVDDPRYFLVHHTPADTVDKIDPVEMAKPAPAVAVMTYVVADLPDRLE